MLRPRHRMACRLISGLTLTAMAGCQMGPETLKYGQSQYSEAVRITKSEQMLLNLVRLRYRDLPVFLEVNNISTQFEFEQSGELSGTFVENFDKARNPNSLGVSGAIGYAERPTISYSIMGGESFLKRMLAPISVASISLVAESGWRTDRVLRLTVEGINGIPNAPTASGPTPSRAPYYREFFEVATLMQDLGSRGFVHTDYETRTERISAPIPIGQVDGDAIVDAAKSGAEFRATDDGQSLVLTKDERTLVLRFSGHGEESQDAARLRDMLHLVEDQSRFDLVAMEDSDFDPLDQSLRSSDLAIDTRSLMGVLYYLSQGVQVPSEHEEAGLVTVTLDEHGERFDWSEILGDLFSVNCSKTRPDNASVAVRHRGWWYSINDSDESSNSTFVMLGQLFALQAGDVESTKPVLTLPVGG